MKTSRPDATITLYGIPNCDTVKRARAWLSAHAIEARFHDFKKDGVPEPRLASWLAALGWETVLNRRGTTWRRLDEEERVGVTDAASAGRLMLAQSSLIKRPVVEWGGGEVTVGFDADTWLRRSSSA
ncbi:MAG TPA: ArsC family reductase [Burkholderiaceae bacterium]|nr:ArsC family reductase [Burkholderiaceae bacterium]